MERTDIVYVANRPSAADKKPRFRFQIRDLLWLTLVVALAVALVLSHLRRSAERAECQRELNRRWSMYMDYLSANAVLKREIEELKAAKK